MATSAFAGGPQAAAHNVELSDSFNRLKAIGLVTKWKYECEEIFKAEMDRRLNSRNVRLPYLLLDIKAIMSEGATSLASLDSRAFGTLARIVELDKNPEEKAEEIKGKLMTAVQKDSVAHLWSIFLLTAAAAAATQAEVLSPGDPASSNMRKVRLFSHGITALQLVNAVTDRVHDACDKLAERGSGASCANVRDSPAPYLALVRAADCGNLQEVLPPFVRIVTTVVERALTSSGSALKQDPLEALELKYGRGGNLLVNRDDNDFVREFICPPLREALQLFENWSQFLWRVNELNHVLDASAHSLTGAILNLCTFLGGIECRTGATTIWRDRAMIRGDQWRAQQQREDLPGLVREMKGDLAALVLELRTSARLSSQAQAMDVEEPAPAAAAPPPPPVQPPRSSAAAPAAPAPPPPPTPFGPASPVKAQATQAPGAGLHRGASPSGRRTLYPTRSKAKQSGPPPLWPLP